MAGMGRDAVDLHSTPYTATLNYRFALLETCHAKYAETALTK